MDYQPDLGKVDTYPKRLRRHHDLGLAGNPIIVHQLLLIRIQLSVVVTTNRSVEFVIQKLAQLLGFRRKKTEYQSTTVVTRSLVRPEVNP